MTEQLALTVSCPSCQRRYRWKPEFANLRIACKCGQSFTLPAQPPAPTPLTLGPQQATAENFFPAPPADLTRNQVLQLLQDDFHEESQQAADAPATPADSDATPNLCPNCHAFWATGATFCLRCGYILASHEAPPTSDLHLLRDGRLVALIASGLTAIAFATLWAILALTFAPRLPASLANYNLLGALALPLALATCWSMSKKQRAWPRLLQAGAYTFTLLGLLIGHATGVWGYLDALWIPLALYFTYRRATRAHAIQRRRII